MTDPPAPRSNRRPGPTLAKLLRAPARLYDWQAGWILGRRFLRLTHIGRQSGRRYHTMLEVIGTNPAAREVIVIAGLGRSAQWYRNLLAHDAIEVAIARERFTPIHRELGEAEAARVLVEYERRNRFVAPLVRRVLSWLLGWPYDGTDTARRRLISQLPVIGFRPADACTDTAGSHRGRDARTHTCSVARAQPADAERVWNRSRSSCCSSGSATTIT